METIEPFTFLERFRLVVCQKCPFAVVAKELATHLRVRHKDVALATRQNIAATVATYLNIIQDQAGLIIHLIRKCTLNSSATVLLPPLVVLAVPPILHCIGATARQETRCFSPPLANFSN